MKLRIKNSTATPSVRFPGFPKPWKANEVRQHASLIGGLTYTPSDVATQGLLVLRSSNVQGGVIELKDNVFVDLHVPEEALSQPSDILVCVRNGSRNLIGKTALLPEGLPKSTHGAFMSLLRGENNPFLFQLLQTTRYHRQVHINLGATINSINGSALRAFQFYFPTLPEQRKIADFLTAVDGRIGQLSQKKALLEDYKKGVMQQLFTQALRFKDDHGNEFPDWEEKTLGDAVIVNPKTSDLPDSFIYIDLESVNAGVLHSPRRISKVDAPSRAQRLLKRGDILYQTVRPYQMNNYLFDLEGVHVASTGYAQLRATRTDARFIYHSLHLPRFVGDVMDRCTGTSYPAINSKDLAQISISIPSLPEQTKIANFLTALDRKIESVSQQITHTQAFKKGLLQQMFV